jgi:hypothetical protein
MRRVLFVFVAFVLAHVVFAFAMRDAFGPAGALTVGATGVGALVVLGIPAFVALRRRGWLAWWQFAAGGAALGIVCAVPLALAGMAFAAALAPAFAALGMLHAVAFWVLAVWRNKALAPTGA